MDGCLAMLGAGWTAGHGEGELEAVGSGICEDFVRSLGVKIDETFCYWQ